MLSTPCSWARSLFHRLFKNPLIRRVVVNSGYLFSATGVSAALSMLQGILAARLLGPAHFGVLGAITTYASTANRFASFRMSEMVVRYVGHFQELNERQRAAAAFKWAVLLEAVGSLVAYGLIWLLAPLGADYFAHDISLAPWFRIYGAVVVANLMFESSTGLLQVLDRFRQIAAITAGQSVITLAIIFVAYINQAGLAAVVIAYMVGKVVGGVAITVTALFQARRKWGSGWWRTPMNSLGSEKRNLLTFAFSTNLSGTISLVAKDSEVLWISAFLGTTQAGYYKLALALVNLLQLPVSPLPKATYPELAREIARNNWANVRYVLRQGSLLSLAYSLPVTVGLILFGKWLIALVYRPEYLPAYPAMVILLLGFTFVNIFYWNRVALLSFSRPVFLTSVNFIGMVLKVGAIFLLVHRYGYLAFAGLLAAYYLFTVGIATTRALMDLRARLALGAAG